MTQLLSQHLPTLSDHYLMDEDKLVTRLLEKTQPLLTQAEAAQRLAQNVITHIRAQNHRVLDINQLLIAYQLTTEEGVALMCVAEALLRIPDGRTRDALIRDKMTREHWQAHGAPNPFARFSNWALNLTGGILNLQTPDSGWGVVGKAISRAGEPVIRAALEQAMKLMGNQFVLGETIDAALDRAAKNAPNVTCSYDMLGEGARTAADAARYFESYLNAIHTTGRTRPQDGVSIKLSALHPRYDWRNPDRMRQELYPAVLKLCLAAKSHTMMLAMDAEESDRLLPSLELFEMLARAPELAGWEGLSFVVQAYGRRALPVIEFITALARETGRRIPVRLVKGAYWDSEIKRAQVDGHVDYPVFTRKVNTDVSYLAAAQIMLAAPDAIFPQFATHNAMTAAMIATLAAEKEYEFQRLHGMGEGVYESLSAALGRPVPYRIYAPVGPHHDLLAYLVRRLLENGANSSFVYQIADKNIPVETLVKHPVVVAAAQPAHRHAKIPLPPQLFGDERKNSVGPLLADPAARQKLMTDIHAFLQRPYESCAIIDGKSLYGARQPRRSPADTTKILGTHSDCTVDQAARALDIAYAAQPEWDSLGGTARAEILFRAADLFEEHIAPLTALITREGGRTIPNAVNDFREAVDFLRYYGAQAAREFTHPVRLPGPTGEQNELWLRGRGVFACIAPWNFPLAIFTGQVAAALAAGNSVLAKPAGQTPMTAHYAVKLLHQAGVPGGVLHLTPGPGRELGALFTESKKIAGIAFTGSTGTANTIYRGLAARGAPIVPFIAETGGQNCMIVDSSALLEQACDDILASAFDSAGQRCSCLRVAFVQEDIADRLIELLKGAAAELRLGNPLEFSTDIGPVIDAAARDNLEQHITRMEQEAKVIFTAALPPETANGTFFAPRIIELTNIAQLPDEVFGPVLHIIRYASRDLEKVLSEINSTGFGLTVGVHSRLDAVHELILKTIRAGNLYVNRTMIGAVVGVQPFGGEGLSGTGPKAGGPHYLHRFATERTVSINTTAAGGNANLIALSE